MLTAKLAKRNKVETPFFLFNIHAILDGSFWLYLVVEI
jgi:hypothetical protein